MPLALYLDDCVDSNLLNDLLKLAGHTVVRPSTAGTTGADDAEHMAYAVANGLILVTKNPADFLSLHNLNRTHSGIFAIYQDNDVNRDMTATEIVAAIVKLEASVPLGYVIRGEYHTLNDWR